jgi:glutaredoxin
MNISYIRKSNKPISEVADAFKKGLKEKNVTIIGETNFSDNSGVMIYFSKPEWIEKIISVDEMLFGVTPNVAIIKNDGGKVKIGILNPQILAGGGNFDKLEKIIDDMDKTLKSIVNESAGVSDPKVEKITVYSTETCPYCRMEKEYLEKNKISFNLIMVDKDQAAAEEMVRKTGQTGVPMTEVVFDDGDSEIIMGFDKGRLKEILNIK